MIEELLDRPIAYHRIFVHIAGVAGAILLSQALYWSKRTSDPNGWFYKTREEWEDETGLGRSAQELARQKLIEAGVMEERLWGIPATMHFKVNIKALELMLERYQQVGRKPANLIAGNQQTNTENTTDINIIKNNNKEPIVISIVEDSSLQDSKHAIVPLTALEQWQMATELNVPLWVVKEVTSSFFEYIEELKNKKKYKTSYKTIRKWIQMGLSKGSYSYNNEVEVMLLQSQHPDSLRELEELKEYARKEKIVE